jgi:hypothetical protein
MTTDELIAAYASDPRSLLDRTADALVHGDGDPVIAVLDYRGAPPEGVHVVDFFPDILSPLLTALFVRKPELLTARDMSKLSSGRRFALLAAGLMTGDARLVHTILCGLDDRSIGVKLLVVRAIVDAPFMRDASARHRLERLLPLASMGPHLGILHRALDALPPRSERDDRR